MSKEEILKLIEKYDKAVYKDMKMIRDKLGDDVFWFNDYIFNTGVLAELQKNLQEVSKK